MIDRSKLPNLRTRPPRRRRHSSFLAGQEPSVATPKVLAALAALVLGILWTVGVLFFSLTVVTVPDGSGRRGQEKQSLDKIPNFNLWPDDEANRILNEHLADCLPQKCTLQSSSVKQKQKQQQSIVITILRPPGVFGSVLERFARDFVKNSKFDQRSSRSVVVQAKSQSPPDAAAAAETSDIPIARKMNSQKQQEYYVHAVTLPLLLQAADLALLTVSDDGDFPQERITWNDLLDVIVLLVRWHCRISTRVSMNKSNYVLKLGLAPTMAHPTKSEYDLAHLLDINLNDYASSGSSSSHPTWMVDRSELSVLVLKRVDQATALLRQMQGFLPGDSTQDLQQAIDSLLQEEFRSSSSGGGGGGDQQSSYCPTKPLRSGGIAGLGLFRWHSRMIDIVDLLLDDNTELVCQTYPTIAYCRELQQPQQYDP